MRKEMENIPRKNTENEIEHEERSEHDERHKVNPVKRAPQSIVGLQKIS
jgi:hypothetical protein